MPRIYNKGKRRIVYHHEPAAGSSPMVEHDLMPEKVKTVDAETAAKVKRLFPGEVVDLDDVDDLQSQFKEGDAVVQDSVQKQIDDAVAKALAKERGEKLMEKPVKASVAKA